MSAAQGRGEIGALLARHGHRPNKRLGQHFLADPNLVARIVTAAEVGPGDLVVEVGSGTGTLTRALAGTGAEVIGFEIDRHLEPVLAEALAGVPADIRFADATPAAVAAAVGQRDAVLVANLPYATGTTLLLDVLQRVPRVVRMVVMVQREVADRLAAPWGSRTYGLPSVVASLRSTVTPLFRVAPTVFVPPPAVESALVELRRIESHPLVASAERLAAVAFAGRRKMLRRSLAGFLDDPEAVLRAAGIDPTARPEAIAPEQFLALAEAAAG
ncbi:MAG: ribosomal RNA small subunit methyltransferase A [Acidimicrobiia bacterium]|nr:ribosomal RNA small subunit methyltransferase A [Acidimicrobiia bacterium]